MSRRTRRCSGASSRCSSASRRSRTRSRSCAGSRRNTSCTTASGSPTARSVAAATLSNRYITDRFLPDKAIDLMDEAALAHPHGGRIQARGDRDARPADHPAQDRARGAEEGEGRGLEGAAEGARERARQARAAVGRADPRWQAEKDKIAGEAKIKEQLDAARLELEQAQRSGDLAKAGELQYGRIPALEKQLEEAAGASAAARCCARK